MVTCTDISARLAAYSSDRIRFPFSLMIALHNIAAGAGYSIHAPTLVKLFSLVYSRAMP